MEDAGKNNFLDKRVIKKIGHALKKAVRVGMVASTVLSPAITLSACSFLEQTQPAANLTMGELTYNNETKYISWKKVKDADCYDVVVQKKGDKQYENSFRTEDNQFSMSQEGTGEYTVFVHAVKKSTKEKSKDPAELTVVHTRDRVIPEPGKVTMQDVENLVIEKIGNFFTEYGFAFHSDIILGYTINEKDNTLTTFSTHKDSNSSYDYIIGCTFPIGKTSSLEDLYKNLNDNGIPDVIINTSFETTPSEFMETLVAEDFISNINNDGIPISLSDIKHYCVTDIYKNRTHYIFDLFVCINNSFVHYRASFLPLEGNYETYDKLLADVAKYPQRLSLETRNISPLTSLENYQWSEKKTESEVENSKPQNASSLKHEVPIAFQEKINSHSYGKLFPVKPSSIKSSSLKPILLNKTSYKPTNFAR